MAVGGGSCKLCGTISDGYFSICFSKSMLFMVIEYSLLTSIRSPLVSENSSFLFYRTRNSNLRFYSAEIDERWSVGMASR